MSKFVKITGAAGKSVAVNLDKILYVEESEKGVYLVYAITEKGLTKGLNLDMSLVDFLNLASQDKG